ncbi:leucocin A/sakacin P family class II bacteriocin [Ligilactobacillus murinus]
MSGGGKLTEKYYGNGLYCDQFTCRSDSRQLWNSVFEISRNGWINSLPKLGTGGGGR